MVSVSVNIGIFWSIGIGIGIGWIEKCSIGIGKYWYNLVVSVQVSVSVSVNIGIFWSISIGIGWIEKYSIGIGKNNTDPPSLVFNPLKPFHLNRRALTTGRTRRSSCCR